MKISVITVIYLGFKCLSCMCNTSNIYSCLKGIILNYIAALSCSINYITSVDGIASDYYISCRVASVITKPDAPMRIIFCDTLIMIDSITGNFAALYTYQIYSGFITAYYIVCKDNIFSNTVGILIAYYKTGTASFK